MTEQTTETTQTPEQIAADLNAFESGHAEARGIEPPAADKPIEKAATPEPAAQPAKPDGAGTPADPAKAAADAAAAATAEEWAGVSPRVRKEFEAMRELLSPIAKLPDRLRTIEGHIGGLTSKTNDLKTALANAATVTKATGNEAPTQSQVQGAMKDPVRWKQLKDDFPEWADAIEPELAALHAAIAAIPKPAAPFDPSGITKDVDTRVANAHQQVIDTLIDLRHDDWKTTVNTPQFEAWYKAQPEEVRKLSSSPKPADAIRMLDLYVASQKKTTEQVKQQQRLKSAITPVGAVVTPSNVTDEDAFELGYKEARASG